MKFLLVVTACVIALINDVHSFTTAEQHVCIVNHLKEHGFLSKNVRSSAGSSSCSWFVENQSKYYEMERLESKISDDLDHEMTSIDCVMKELKKTNVGDLLLLEVYFAEIKKSHNENQAKKREENKKKIEKMSFDAILTCSAEKPFGGRYDKIQSGQIEPAGGDTGKFCVRKTLVDKKLIDSNVALQMNPEGLETDTDCTYVNMQFVKQEEKNLMAELRPFVASPGRFSMRQNDCFLTAIRSGDYVNKFMQYYFVKEMNLDKNAKAQKRVEFINQMKSMVIDSLGCKNAF